MVAIDVSGPYWFALIFRWFFTWNLTGHPWIVQEETKHTIVGFEAAFYCICRDRNSMLGLTNRQFPNWNWSTWNFLDFSVEVIPFVLATHTVTDSTFDIWFYKEKNTTWWDFISAESCSLGISVLKHGSILWSQNSGPFSGNTDWYSMAQQLFSFGSCFEKWTRYGGLC